MRNVSVRRKKKEKAKKKEKETREERDRENGVKAFVENIAGEDGDY